MCCPGIAGIVDIGVGREARCEEKSHRGSETVTREGERGGGMAVSAVRRLEAYLEASDSKV